MKDLESLNVAFVAGTFPLLLIGIARVPFLDATAGWAALLAECAGPALGYGEHQCDAAQYRQIAELCTAAGMDEAPVEACAPGRGCASDSASASCSGPAAPAALLPTPRTPPLSQRMNRSSSRTAYFSG